MLVQSYEIVIIEICRSIFVGNGERDMMVDWLEYLRDSSESCLIGRSGQGRLAVVSAGSTFLKE